MCTKVPHNLSNMLINFGIAFGFKTTIGLILVIIGIIVGYWLTLEEKLLIQQFGDKYREYEARVPMFISKLRRKSQLNADNQLNQNLSHF